MREKFKDEIKREIGKYLETDKNENIPLPVGCSKSSTNGEVYSNKLLH